MSQEIIVTLGPGVTNITEEEVRRSALFTQWVERMDTAGMNVRKVDIHHVLQWGKPTEPKMIYLSAWAVDPDGTELPPIAAHLRGDTVDTLAILQCEGEEYVVFVMQPRVPGASICISNPSGMVDTGEEVSIAALREVDEELGHKIKWSKPERLVYRPLLVSPGGTAQPFWG
ncbi:NUDIX domain-containing protein [Shimazuella kribbensis]|uniref:NUDIX domain-containing protein n=1 Tax=Shimazuella kribbensis TaxID=139808 RepID=UPI00041AC31E|nr:NUDIX domain-containing protein [Shimazuella kribbensis]